MLSWNCSKNNGIKCPCCGNADMVDMFDLNTNGEVKIAGMEIDPVVCGVCGTVFIRPYHLQKLYNSHAQKNARSNQ